MNPYFGQNFFSFWVVFFKRLFTFDFFPLASDEVQMAVLALSALSSALIGTFLVLKKMTMVANSLSHTLLIGIAFVFWIYAGSGNVPFWALMVAALFMAFITVGLIHFFINSLRLKEDAATGLVFTSLFAMGILFVTLLTRSGHVGVEAVTGNVDALTPQDLFPVFIIALVNTFVFFLFFRGFKLVAFDPLYAQFLGYRILLFDAVLLSLTALTLITSFRAIGVLMILAFLTAPILSGRLFIKRLAPLVLYSIFLGVFISLISVALARHLLTVYDLAVSTSGLTVLLLTIAFLLHVAAYYYKRKSRVLA